MPRLPARFSAPHKDFFSPRKQSGFTLIELMVAMTIIAILTTTGFLAYTGYLKNARDAVRIADVGYMDTVVSDYLHSYGLSPASVEDFTAVVAASNHGQPIVDPLNNAVACITAATDTTPTYCSYLYITCDGGAGYLISAKFETSYQTQYYTPVPGDTSEWFYNRGRCTAIDTPPPLSVPEDVLCRTKADCETDSVCVGPQPKHCRLKADQGIGASCDTNNECLSNKCKNKVCEA